MWLPEGIGSIADLAQLLCVMSSNLSCATDLSDPTYVETLVTAVPSQTAGSRGIPALYPVTDGHSVHSLGQPRLRTGSRAQASSEGVRTLSDMVSQPTAAHLNPVSEAMLRNNSASNVSIGTLVESQDQEGRLSGGDDDSSVGTLASYFSTQHDTDVPAHTPLQAGMGNVDISLHGVPRKRAA